MFEASNKHYKLQLRETVSLSEGEISLGLSFCKKNPDYLSLSPDLLQEISQKELYTKLFQYMKNRPRSRWECELKLKNSGFLQNEIDAGITFFESQNWINDLIFAQFVIEGSQNYRPLGVFSLKQKLQDKKVPQEIIEEALQNYQKENSIITDGIKLLETQIYRFEKYQKFEKQDKIWQYLYRRGFSSTHIQEILKNIKEQK